MKKKQTPNAVDYWGIAETLAEQFNIYFPSSYEEMIDASHFYPYISNPNVISLEDILFCIDDEVGRGFLIGIITEHIRNEFAKGQKEEEASEST